MRAELKTIPGDGIKAPSTIRRRKTTLNIFWNWMERSSLTENDLTVETINDYISYRLDMGVKATTMVDCDIRHIGMWVRKVAKRFDLYQQWDEVEKPKGTPVPYKAFNVHEDAQVMNSARDQQGFVLLCLSRFAGLRIGEAMALEWESIDMSDPERWFLTIEPYRYKGWEPKGHRCRTIPVATELQKILKVEYQDMMEDHIDPHVAVRKFGGDIGPWLKRPARMWETIRYRTGIKKACHHRVRATWATRLASAGVRLEKIQEWAGHRYHDTTKRYIDAAQIGTHDEIDLSWG